MPNPTVPSVLPVWTQGNNSVRTQPTNGEQFTGFTPNFRPPAGWHNWLFGIMSDWIEYLAFAIQGNNPVSNVGHNILIGTTLQQQLDECDAFLSSIGLSPVTLLSTSNPNVFTLSKLPLNGSLPIIFVDGVESTPGVDFTYSVTSGIMSITWANLPSSGQPVSCFALTAVNPGSGGTSVSGGFVAYGSEAMPIAVTAAGGIAATSDQRQLWYIQGSNGTSPAPVIISSTPQITAGTKVGQEMRLVGADSTNYVELNTGNGLFLNGPVTLLANQSIDFEWNGTVWRESDRSN